MYIMVINGTILFISIVLLHDTFFAKYWHYQFILYIKDNMI